MRGSTEEAELDDARRTAPLLLFATHPLKRHAEPWREPPLPRLCARKDGFSLHAGIAVHGNDRQGLERLVR